MSYKGIFFAKKKNGSEYYRVSVTSKGKHISLGSFEILDEALKCRKEADEILLSENLTIDDYDNSYSLSFEKFVILINYRDNGIYIPNPIYLSTNLIYYYLDKDTVLKFDRDDLFYYSTHKICKRGNHLFCYEYGNQISINERYSIPAYAIIGKDYRFINNDIYDFRYSNIEIINRYHGVRKKIKDRKTVYEVKIHLNGYIKIGEFEDEITAAIAYNKAVDLLKKNNSKDFIQNYPELNAKEYAAIYSGIQLPDKLYTYI